MSTRDGVKELRELVGELDRLTNYAHNVGGEAGIQPEVVKRISKAMLTLLAKAEAPDSQRFDPNGEYYNLYVVCPKCGKEGRLDTYGYYRNKPAAPPAPEASPLNIEVDPSVPPNEIHMRDSAGTVHKITNLAPSAGSEAEKGTK